MHRILAERPERALRRQRLNQVLGKMKSTKLAAAWGKWHEMHSLARKARKVMRRMQLGAVFRCFARWVELVTEAKEMKAKVKRSLAKRICR